MALKGPFRILLMIHSLAIANGSIRNACLLHHVNITSEPVIITSSIAEDNSRSRQNVISNCTLDLYVQEGNALFVEILNSTSSDTYSYLYFEDLNNSNSKCLKRYLLTSLSSTPCNTFVAYKPCRLHLRNTYVTLKLKGVDVVISECIESGNLMLPWIPLPDNSIIPRCEMSTYDYEYRLTPVSYNSGYKNYVTFEVECPRKCNSTLGYRKLSILCNDLKNSAELLLVYDKKWNYIHWNGIHLSFRYVPLTIISSNALFGNYLMRHLDLGFNYLTTLDASTFKGLSEIDLLNLACNLLSFLPATVFNDLVKLRLIILSCNQLSELPIGIFINKPRLLTMNSAYTNLATLEYQHIASYNSSVQMLPTTYSILSGLVSLRNLHLPSNKLTSVSKVTFDDLVELRFLDLSDNPLHMLNDDTFSEMPLLTGVSLSGTYLKYIASDIFKRNDGLRDIILRENHLTTLPASVFLDLKDLELLDLSKNSFHSLPDGLFKSLRRVYVLFLFENKLQQLPKHIFDGMLDLKVLNLNINELTSLPRGIFDDLISLHSLSLYSNRLNSLPGDIFRSLPQLKFLFLYDNELIAFPVNGTFHSLQNLDTLLLSNNSLTSLSDDEFGGMFQLERLVLENNNLSVLSNNSFADLLRITELRLGYNKLKILHKGVFRNLVEIVKISLINNQLNTLPDTVFKGLHKLRRIELTSNKLTTLPTVVFATLNSSFSELYLGDNQLEYLPPGIFSSLYTLTHLHLYNNKLATLSNNTFQNLFELFELDLSKNHLRTFAQGTFQSLTKLNYFFVERNQITDLPFGVFDNMTSMTYLDMSHNRLTNMPKNFLRSLTSLKFLNISYNYLYQLPRLHSLTNLQVLDASFNQLSSLNRNIFQHNTEIIYISLDSNAIFTLPIDVFQNLQSLQVLTCTNNLLNTLPPGIFGNLTSLISLNLSYNHLSDIPDLFWGLFRLEHLEIQQNALHTVPAGVFDHCMNLKFINFSTNSIRIIGHMVFNETNIQILDLRSNNLYLVTKASFTKLQDYTLLVDNSLTCCFADNITCISEKPKPVYLTCRRILNGTLLQMSMWGLGLFTSLFNILVFCIRYLQRNKSSKVQGLLISHLSLSDFLMGVNLLLLAAADVIFGDYFPSYSDQWRNGPVCKVAGILSILSSEVSVFFITLISFDRFQGVKYPFSSNRLRPKSAKVCIGVIWCFGLILSVVPNALSVLFPDVYEVSEVCVGIPIVKRPVLVSNDSFVALLVNETDIGYEYEFVNNLENLYYNYIIKHTENLILSRYTFSKIVDYKLATYFSLIVFVGVNLVCFGLVAFFYVQIFKHARKSSRSAGRKPDEKQEIRRAMKMSVIVLTDFCTWVPLLLVCILAQSNVIKVNPSTYAWTVALILPINSAINPFLYTILMLIEGRTK